MIYFQIIALIGIAYLIGGIPTSIWVGRFFFNIDIREYGSGNAGATNFMRVLGVRVGLAVLIFDIFKGWAAVYCIRLFNVYPPDTDSYINLQIILGIAAVIGHIYPVYAGFKGGKGVATVFGVLLALHPLATLCAAGVFIVSLLSTKFVSVSSMAAGLSFPICLWFVFNSPFLYLRLFSILVSILLILTHMKNIRKLMAGEEKKASFLFGN
jgi:acyl phosphate:glycerol-3-phosphate acyltransferase